MSLLPVVSGQVALDSTATSASDVFNGGIRFAQAGQAKCTTDVGTFFNQGIPMTADGAVSVVDATAGLPAGTTFSSGLPISGNRLCVSTNVVSVTANGITFDAAGAVSATGFAPAPPPVSSDPYFEYVTLLTNTTSTNGAQNNTFLDGSTNAFSITRNGNTTQGTFSPFSQTGWSNFFDGTGDYLSVADNAALEPGASNFTIETYIYLTQTSGSLQTIFSKNTTFGPILLAVNGTSVIYYLSSTGASWDVASAVSGGSITIGSWNHIALVRNGNTFTPYVNGVAGTTTTSSATLVNNATALQIGANNNGSAEFLFGYVSNWRYVVGTAVYTANFTPPTSPLTAITNTSLLTCQSNRFIDNSSNAFAITRNGDVSVQAFSPFNPTAAWSAGTNGGSGYFDGTGDYLSVADNVALEPATGDFCVESWVYFNALGIGNIYNAQQQGPSISLNASNQIEFGQSYVSVLLADTVAATTGQWYHVAVCRSGTTLSMFVNGSRRATATNSTNFNTTVANYIGWNGGSAYLNGYLSNLRLVKGSSVYDPTLTTLTVPTAPLTAITNTSLLCNFTNAGIFDSASGNDLETVGNAQVSTTQAKFGTTSMAFDGAASTRLTFPSRPIVAFRTSPYTIEAWIYLSSHASTQTTIVDLGNATGSLNVTVSTTGALQLREAGVGATLSSAAGAISLNTWTHIAVVRQSTAANATALYVNGISVAVGTDSINYTVTTNPCVGGINTAGFTLNGYIDDLRITTGIARYTTAFTPPTAAFPLN